MDNFISLVKDGAIQGQVKYGILASLSIAQAILESGWGDHAPNNNLFGIKWVQGCGFDYANLSTTEYINGVKVAEIDKFRKYNSFNDSILDHTNFLVQNSRYSNLIGVTDYKKACTLIQTDGYATDPNYSKLLIEIIEENNLTQYDLIGSVSNMNIKIGENSPRVKIVQQLLVVAGATLTIDGQFGVKTQGVIIEFQKNNGLTPSGQVDLNTINKLMNNLIGELKLA